MRRLLAVLAMALLAPGLAGCFGSKSPAEPPAMDAAALAGSPAIFKVKAPEEVWVASSVDGKRMENAVYRPDTTGPVPVFINFSPYWADTSMKEGDAFAHYMIHEYVARGYAVVLSAVRGTGHSEGCFQIGGDLELKDTRDVVDFFAKQPWSNGNIAAGGKSYDATSQNGMIAKFPSPALKGIFHVSGITDMYRYNGKDGVTYSNGIIFNTDYGLGQGLSEYAGGAVPGSPDDETPQSLLRAVDDVACLELIKENLSGVGSAVDGMKDAYWQERDWVKALPTSNWQGSVFMVHGLQDWNVKPDNIVPWIDELQANHIELFAWLHQWQTPDGSGGTTGHVYPMREDWNRTMLQWLDHTLKGKANGWTAGFEVEGSDEIWRAGPHWPEVPGSTLINATGKEGVLQFAAGTRVTGTPILQVGAVPLTPDPVIHATWYDLGPDGKLTWVNEAVRRGALSDDLSTPRMVTPGSQATWSLTFYPMDAVLAPGHAWVIKLGAAPVALPGNQVDAGQADFVITPWQEQVQYDAPTMSVQLHVSAARLGVVDPQPTPMKCFTC